jgi:hypothetical protein
MIPLSTWRIKNMNKVIWFPKSLVPLGLALIWICSNQAAVQAEPLELKQVASDAQWVAHIDVDAIKESIVVQRAYDWCMTECAEAGEQLAKIREKLGLDLTEDLQSVTFYGKKIKIGVGVAIVHANVDQADLEAKVQGARDYTKTEHGSHTLHQWTHKQGGHEHQVTGCFHSPTTLLFGRRSEDVIAALDVLDGKAASLEGSDSSLAVASPSGTMLAVKASRLEDMELPSRSPMIKLGKSFSVVLGEDGGESFAIAKLMAKSDEMAKQVMELLEGFHALALMQREDDPLAQEVLHAVKANTEGNKVTVELRASADEVWERAKILRERMEQNGSLLKP